MADFMNKKKIKKKINKNVSVEGGLKERQWVGMIGVTAAFLVAVVFRAEDKIERQAQRESVDEIKGTVLFSLFNRSSPGSVKLC